MTDEKSFPVPAIPEFQQKIHGRHEAKILEQQINNSMGFSKRYDKTFKQDKNTPVKIPENIRDSIQNSSEN